VACVGKVGDDGCLQNPRPGLDRSGGSLRLWTGSRLSLVVVGQGCLLAVGQGHISGGGTMGRVAEVG
jgi:hypothetical protein